MRWSGLLYYTGKTARGTLDGAVSHDDDTLAGAVDGPGTLPGGVSTASILLPGTIS